MWFCTVCRLLKFEICLIYPGVGVIPAEDRIACDPLQEIYKKVHLSKTTIASDMGLVPKNRATVVLHLGKDLNPQLFTKLPTPA